MATSFPLRVGDVLPLVLAFKDANGNLLYTLTAAPDGKLCLPNGTIIDVPMTQRGASPYWDPTTPVTATVDGGHGWWGVSTDPNVAVSETETVWIHVGMIGVTSEFDGAAETDIDAILAKTNLLGTNDSSLINSATFDGEAIPIVIGDDYLISQGREIVFTNLACPDLTTATSIEWLIDRQLVILGEALSPDSCRFELLSSQSNMLKEGKFEFDLLGKWGIPAEVTIIRSGYTSHLPRVRRP